MKIQLCLSWLGKNFFASTEIIEIEAPIEALTWGVINSRARDQLREYEELSEDNCDVVAIIDGKMLKITKDIGAFNQ